MSLGITALPVKKREIIGWAMYDFANSSYTTVVITFIYSAFFISYIVPPELVHMKNTFWSIAIAISTALAILLAPIVGVLCDYSGKKKKYLAMCTFISVFATAALFFVQPGQVWFGLVLLIFSNTAWMLSESFIASFLPELATQKNMGKVSGLGWGIGYVGGLLSLLLMASFITADKVTDFDLYVNQNQMAMIFISAFYLLGALPTFLFVKERAIAKPGFEQATFQKLLAASFTRVADMKSIIKDYPVLFKFFWAFMIYAAGIAVVVKFFGIYAQEEIGISGTDLLMIGATLQISSMVGAIGFGLIEDKIGSKQTIFVSLIWWVMGILGMYFLEPLVSMTGLDTNTLFVIIAFVAGCALGATQSASRAVVGLLAKPEDSALLFGLWGTFGRFAIIIGMSFGPISDAIGRHSSLLFILVYFIIGGAMLAYVPLNKAITRPN